jgi:hypothetical protein
MNSSANPGPSSVTCSSTRPFVRCADMEILPPAVAERVFHEVPERLLCA